MRKIAEVAGLSLKWSQPSALRMHYELHAGDVMVATLSFRSMLGSFATGTSGDGCWTFKRVGFWQTRATIRECERENQIGEFRNKTWTGGGTLELPDGRSYQATTNFWQTQLAFQDESGTPLLRLKSGGVIHLSAGVEIEPASIRVPEISWMTMLGWYLIVMMHMDSGSTAAAASSG